MAARALLSSLRSKTSQVLGSVQRWAVSPASSSDPRSSVLEDLMELERKLKRILAALRDAEEREIRDDAVKLWLKELKEVAYDAEDVLDEYHYEELRAEAEARASRKRKRVEGDDEQQQQQVSGSLMTTVISIPDCMGGRIREIRKKFDEISKDRDCLRLRDDDGERRGFGPTNPAPTSHMLDLSSIYGREDDKKKVIDLLFSESVGNINGMSVIPIVGKGGLGKTTVAQLVYNDSKIKEFFDLTGWVCVSDDFDVTRLTKIIIESLSGSSCDLTQPSTLQNTLEEKVKGKRVLLVLDDVWNEKQCLWESLKIPLVGAGTVRIMVTCRNDSVAEIMQTVHSYHPDCLSKDESWSLFRHYAFGGRDSEEQLGLVNIGKQIVEKCSGLPLAVKTIGSLLGHMTDEDRWMEVLESDIWELDRNNETLAALRLSYNRMPAHLKPCFVYCSMFPKDYVFDTDVLVRLWMAQGFIPLGCRRRMEDIGHEYFTDLQRRSFFDSFYFGFKMHDMMHDLAKSIAGNECCAIIDKKLPDFPNQVRHLYMQGDEKLMKSCSHNLWALRTLILIAQCRDAKATQFQLLLQGTRCLRTLEFYWRSRDELPDAFGHLKHLRYLHIQSQHISKLPESVCLLYHLQILILHCDVLAELPDNLGNLANLCHLDIQETSICCLPAGIEKLTNLHSLFGSFKARRGREQGEIELLKDLKKLQGTLQISGLSNLVNMENARDAGLKYKHKLEELFLNWHHVENYVYGGLCLKVGPEENKDVPADEKWEEAIIEHLQPHANLKRLHMDGYGGSKFPKWMENPLSFASLQKIDITNCEKVRSLPLYIHDALGKLDPLVQKEPPQSMLESVHINSCQQLTSILGMHNLHSLKVLEIKHCPQLQLLSEEGLPSKLEKLHIEQCQKLTSIAGLSNLHLCKELEIKHCVQLRLLFEEGMPSKLEKLHIEQCQQLTSITWLHNLHSLKELEIKYCPQLCLLSVPSKLEKLHIEQCQQLTRLQNLLSFRELDILLSDEGLPSKFGKLHIEQCQQLTSIVGLHNLHSFKELEIKHCPRLQFLLEEGLPSKLEKLYIEQCQQLTSIAGLHNLHSCKELEIKHCPQLKLVSNEGLPSKLEKLHIEQCQKLTSIRLYDLHLLKELEIKYCPQLLFFVNINWLSLPSEIFLPDASLPSEIFQPDASLPSKIFQSDVSFPSSLEKLHIEQYHQSSFMPRLHELRSLKELEIKYCTQLQLLSEEVLPSKLEKLHIAQCQCLNSIARLHNLHSCKELVIKHCPQLQLLPEEALPSKLEKLRIEQCLQLTSIAGLHNLHSLKDLIIYDCPQLQLLSKEGLPSKLEKLYIVQCPQLKYMVGLRNLHSCKELEIKHCHP